MTYEDVMDKKFIKFVKFLIYFINFLLYKLNWFYKFKELP